MKLWLLPAILALAGYFAYGHGLPPLSAPPSAPIAQGDGTTLDAAIARHLANQTVSGTGTVARVLPDDEDGSRHQRFILRLASGQTVLVAHNIDLASRIPDLAVGDRIAFSGEYVWNHKGGVLHWTHRDPNGRHAAGWLQRGERLYQ
jgi:hypothetical protein